MLDARDVFVTGFAREYPSRISPGDNECCDTKRQVEPSCLSVLAYLAQFFRFFAFRKNFVCSAWELCPSSGETFEQNCLVVRIPGSN